MQLFLVLNNLKINKKLKKKNNKNMKNKIKYFAFFISSAFVGFINGIFGGGGGLICVPILKKLLKLTDKQAHATAVLIMSIISIPTVIIYITTISINWWQTLLITFGVLIGGLIGAVFLKKINNKTINIIFIIIMFCAGIKMLF